MDIPISGTVNQMPPCQSMPRHKKLPMPIDCEKSVFFNGYDGRSFNKRSCDILAHPRAIETVKKSLVDNGGTSAEAGTFANASHESAIWPVENKQPLPSNPGDVKPGEGPGSMNHDESENMNHDEYVSNIIKPLIDSNDYHTLRNLTVVPREKSRYPQQHSTMLIYAIEKGRPDCVAALISRHPELCSMPSSKRLYPIHVAAREGQLECLEKIITAGYASSPCEGCMQKDSLGNTALHYACQAGQLDCIDYIIKQYPDGVHDRNNRYELAAEKIFISENPEKNLQFFIKQCSQIPEYLGKINNSLLERALGLNKKGCLDVLLRQFSILRLNNLSLLN